MGRMIPGWSFSIDFRDFMFLPNMMSNWDLKRRIPEGKPKEFSQFTPVVLISHLDWSAKKKTHKSHVFSKSAGKTLYFGDLWFFTGWTNPSGNLPPHGPGGLASQKSGTCAMTFDPRRAERVYTKTTSHKVDVQEVLSVGLKTWIQDLAQPFASLPCGFWTWKWLAKNGSLTSIFWIGKKDIQKMDRFEGLGIYLYSYLSVYPSIYLSIYPSIYL